MKVYLGSDHGGFELKENVKSWLTEWNIPFEDVGAHTLDPEDDYPVFAFDVADQVGAQDNENLSWQERPKGILLCRSAGGVVIAANKVKGVRAVAAVDTKSAEHARLHNDANVLALSGDWLSESEAQKIVRVFVTTEFSGEARHKRRLDMIREKEKLTTGT